MEKKDSKTGYLPICPFEDQHPEMLIGTPQRDSRLDVMTGCEYTENKECRD